MTPKLSLTSLGFPTQVWNSSEAIQRKVWSGIFFKRDHMSQDGLFWNNMPGQLINLWQLKHGRGKLCLSNSTMAAFSCFLKISFFSKLEFCIYQLNIAGFKLSWLVDGLTHKTTENKPESKKMFYSTSELYFKHIFQLLTGKSSIWFTEKHTFKIIIYIYFFNTLKCAAFNHI